MRKTKMEKGVWQHVFVLEAVQARVEDLLSNMWSSPGQVTLVSVYSRENDNPDEEIQSQ